MLRGQVWSDEVWRYEVRCHEVWCDEKMRPDGKIASKMRPGQKMKIQMQADLVEQSRLAAAAASFLDVVTELYTAERNAVTDLIGDAPFTQWDHFPPRDFYDAQTGALFFYHAHDPADRHNGEHGHFHCFVERSRIEPAAVPIYQPAPQDGTKPLCHIIAVSIDMNGLPTELFTTNQWVTGECFYPAEAVIALIDSFSFPGSRDSSLVSRWLADLVALFRPQIMQLLVQRDANLGINRKSRSKLRSRSIDVVSRLAIDVDEQIANVSISR